MTFPRDAPHERLLQIDDLVERAHLLAREAHAGQQDKVHSDYYNAHLLDVHRRAATGRTRTNRRQRCCTT